MFVRSSVRWAFILGMIYTVVENSPMKQIPPSQQSEKGSTVQFYCIFPLTSDQNAIKVRWWKDGDRDFLDAKKDSRKTFTIPNKASAVFQLQGLRVSDAGTYYCQVEGAHTGNGTGSELRVSAPPTDLKISSTGSSLSPTYMCTTTGFYPESLKMEFFKNDNKLTGVKELKQKTPEGDYNFSSSVEEKQPVPIGTVYSCKVSHSALKNSPKTVTYTVIPEGKETEDPFPWWIYACISAGVLLLLTIIIILVYCCRKRAKRRKSDRCVRCSGLKTAKPQCKQEELSCQIAEKPKTNVNQGTKVKNKAPKIQKHRTKNKDPILE